jgi:hypothetical protein
LYVERKHFIQGLVSYDVEAAEAKMEATEKHIKKRHTIATIANVIMILMGFVGAGLFFVGNFMIVYKWIENGTAEPFKVILGKCGYMTLAAFILFVIAVIAYKVMDVINEKDDFDFYSIAELFLWTETADMITSFINYSETRADLYLQYKKYKEDEDGEMIETTGVYVIEGFKVKRTAMSKEPILDINNGIYYVPYRYVNKRNNS